MKKRTLAELSTVLAALRYWQATLSTTNVIPARFHDIATDGGEVKALGVGEIDTLCEHLNCGGYPEPGKKAFTKEEMLTLLEAASLALADGETFDALADKLDTKDDDMVRLREKLKRFMATTEPPYGPSEENVLAGGHIYLTLNSEEPAIGVNTLRYPDGSVAALVPDGCDGYTLKCAEDGELFREKA